jgi:hypothetical protein
MRQLKIFSIAVAAAMALTAFLGVGTAGASSIKVFGASTSLPAGTVIEASLEAGNSTVLEDSFGFTAVTCTGSSWAATISRVTPTGQPKGSFSALNFIPCGHTVDVESRGELEIRNIAGTTNGTVFWSGAKVKVFSTLLNQSCIANTGTGTDLGTLTGAPSASGKATLDMNALMPLEGCSASSARWTGKDDVSKPLGLVSEA